MKKNSGNIPENKISAEDIEQNLIERLLINYAKVGQPDPDLRLDSTLRILSKSISQVMAEELGKF